MPIRHVVKVRAVTVAGAHMPFRLKLFSGKSDGFEFWFDNDLFQQLLLLVALGDATLTRGEPGNGSDEGRR